MIKAIETRYNGCKFRSRLEARWAVFLDKLKVKYEYELEGYKIQSNWNASDRIDFYLPDFYLPTFKLWLEIKPAVPNGDYQRRLISFAMEIGDPILCLIGTPSIQENSQGIAVMPVIDSSDQSLSIFMSPITRFLSFGGNVMIEISANNDAPCFVYKGAQLTSNQPPHFHFDMTSPSEIISDEKFALVLGSAGEYHTSLRSPDIAGRLWSSTNFAVEAARSARFEANKD